MNHTVAVTGGTRTTGKTTSVAVLGAVLADAGADVLLVDCDLADPSLAAALSIFDPDATLRDVFAGRATLADAAHTGPAGAAVVPGGQFSVPNPSAIRDFVDAIDGFDIVVCDTGDPFSDATAGACDAADGAIVTSTSDDAARRNTAAVHGSLRKHGQPLLGTVLTRVQGDADISEWECDILATIPESDAVARGVTAVLDSQSDPSVECYRELARGVSRRLREDPDGTASNDALWLPQPADPFLTPAVAAGGVGDADASSNDEVEGPEPAVGADDASSGAPPVADGGTGSAGSESDSTAGADGSAEEPTEDDDSGFRLTRRGALAALTAAVGGVSAGILNTRETPTIEAFGYGGRPVTSTDSGAANATNDTTDAGSISAGGVNRTEQTTELVDDGSDEDLTANETETGGVDNTTDSGNVTNTTDPENTTDSGNVTDTTDSSEEPTPTQDSDDGSSTDTDGSSPTNGGSTGTGDGTTTDDGSGNETGTDDGSGSDDTTDETSPSEPGDGEFGTVGYGQGGYGGVE